METSPKSVMHALRELIQRHLGSIINGDASISTLAGMLRISVCLETCLGFASQRVYRLFHLMHLRTILNTHLFKTTA